MELPDLTVSVFMDNVIVFIMILCYSFCISDLRQDMMVLRLITAMDMIWKYACHDYK